MESKKFKQGEDGRALSVIHKELIFLVRMYQKIEDNTDLIGVFKPASCGILLKLNQNLFNKIMN